jgi:hypothetical protein
MKKALKITAGILLIPIIFILFYADRIVLLFLPWKEQKTIQVFYNYIDNIIIALWRVLTVAIFYILYLLIF